METRCPLRVRCRHRMRMSPCTTVSTLKEVGPSDLPQKGSSFAAWVYDTLAAVVKTRFPLLKICRYGEHPISSAATAGGAKLVSASTEGTAFAGLLPNLGGSLIMTRLSRRGGWEGLTPSSMLVKYEV